MAKVRSYNILKKLTCHHEIYQLHQRLRNDQSSKMQMFCFNLPTFINLSKFRRNTQNKKCKESWYGSRNSKINNNHFLIALSITASIVSVRITLVLLDKTLDVAFFNPLSTTNSPTFAVVVEITWSPVLAQTFCIMFPRGLVTTPATFDLILPPKTMLTALEAPLIATVLATTAIPAPE